MTVKHVLAMVAVIVLGAVVAMTDQKQVLVLKDGRRLTGGEVTRTDDGDYLFRKYGAVTKYKADQVLRVEKVESVSEELTKRLSKIAPDDADGFYKVARWAYDNDQLEDARKILLKTLKLKPDHKHAGLLLTIVKSRLGEKAVVTPTTTTTNGSVVKPPYQKFDPSMFLTKEDIYRIRLMELKPGDRVTVEFRNDVLERFKKSMQGVDIFANRRGERKFDRYSNVKKVMYILENTDIDNVSIRDDILIKSDPSVMKEFRFRVWPILARTFASSTCFGGVKGRDGLKLFNLAIGDERVLYTNFYILHRWQRGKQRFINREKREMSLLLQWGLPRKIALEKAPEYLRPIYLSRKDRKYKIIDKWIESLRWPFLSPGYRIKYKPPGQKPPKPPTPTTTTAPTETEEEERRRD